MSIPSRNTIKSKGSVVNLVTGFTIVRLLLTMKQNYNYRTRERHRYDSDEVNRAASTTVQVKDNLTKWSATSTKVQVKDNLTKWSDTSTTMQVKDNLAKWGHYKNKQCK